MTSTALSERQPTKQSDAATLAHRVISSYPSVNPLELKGYLAEMVHLLVNYSEGVAMAAVEKAMLASPNFPPPVPLVQSHCDELIASSRAAFEYASQWEAQSQRQLTERQQIEATAEPLEYRRKVVERVLGEYQAKTSQPTTPVSRETWQRFSPEDLLRKYPPKHPKQEAAE